MNLSNLTVDQKFARVIIDLRNIRPFYSAVYETMPHLETEEIDTVGVTSDKLYYNREFVDKIEYQQFLFIILHEVCHMALMHVARRSNRDAMLYNIACDLVVNKLLAEEFEILPGETTKDGIVSMPLDGCYCSTVDTDIDFVEQIYSELEKQGKHNGYLQSTLTLNNGDKGYYFSYKGSGNGDNTNSFKTDRHKTFEVTLVPNSYECDIMNDSKDKMQQENDAKKVLSEAKTKYEMSSKNAGSSPGKLKFMVDEILKSHIDWRKILRKFCIQHRSTDSSFDIPDKRMYYQSAIYPGQSADMEEILKNVKVCIDTSGSISDTDLAYFFGQIRTLLKQYKTTAEIVCWDTEIETTYDFSDVRTIVQKGLTGRGGTDPTCIFEYFDSKKCKVKPFVTLIFTDGFFGDLAMKAKWKKQYKNTVWIMTKEHNKTFNPPFGKVALAKFNE